MMKTALALAAVLGLANGQAPTAAAPNNQCDDEGDACEGAEPEGGGDRTGGNADCMAALAEWSPERGPEADCAGNAQCTAVMGCFAQMMLFHEARQPARQMCPWVGGAAWVENVGPGTLRTEEQCTSAACKWCAADAECDSQHEENGAAVASCTYNPDFVFLNLNSPTTAGGIFVATACGLKDSEASCTQIEEPARTASPATCEEDVWGGGKGGTSVADDATACAAVTALDDETGCIAVMTTAGDQNERACRYTRAVTAFAGKPAPCAWAQGQCAATAAATQEAAEEFAEKINDANEATAAIGDKASHAVTAEALSGAVAALFMCVAY